MTSSSTGPITSPVRPGETFAGKYLVEKVLGAGGMGVVLAAHHPQLGQKVAIKLLIGPLAGKPEIAARFLREARAAAQLRNQHIARVMDAGTDEAGRQYIVMEHLNGSDLRAHYRNEGPRPIPVTVGYVLHACEALAEAHAAGIVHRDLKPENLFLTLGADGSPLIKVLDFGISKNLQLSPGGDPGHQIITTAQDILGSPAYMSPEQLRAPESVDARTDVWALGVILYELLTTRRPFSPPALADLIAEVLSLTPPPPHTLNDQIPEKLSAVIMRCLVKKADNRYRSVGELAQALRPWAPRWARESSLRAARTEGKGDPSQSADLPAPGDEAEPSRSAIRWAALLPVGLAMIAGVVFLALARKPPEEAPVVTPPAPPMVEPAPASPAAAPAPPPAAPALPATPPVVTAPAVAEEPEPEPEPPAPARVVSPAANPDATGKARRVARPQVRRIGGGKPTGRLGAAEVDPLEGRR